MTSNSDELAEALQENMKLRLELATEVVEVKSGKKAAMRYRLARKIDAFRYALFGRSGRASISAAVVELMTLDGSREQYAKQLRQLDRQALLKEIEQLQRLLRDLPHPLQSKSDRPEEAVLKMKSELHAASEAALQLEKSEAEDDAANFQHSA
jgi:hypothetical protein